MAVVVAFALLGRWQWSRADAGNARSYGYAFEWPLFAAFAVFWWWRTLRLELHPPAPADEPRAGSAPDRPSRQASVLARAEDDESDPELAAYNRRLAWLNEQDQRGAR